MIYAVVLLMVCAGYFGYELVRKRTFHAAWTFMAWFSCLLGSSFVTFVVWETVRGVV